MGDSTPSNSESKISFVEVFFMSIRTKLKSFLKDRQKLLFLTIGNELRGDDGLGPYFAREFSKFRKGDDIIILDGGTVPENFTGKIRKEDPTHIIIVDAVEMGEVPGTISIIEEEKIAEYNISTHAMPISFLIKYLKANGDFKIIVLGVQPARIELSDEISADVKKAIEKILHVFQEILGLES